MLNRRGLFKWLGGAAAAAPMAPQIAKAIAETPLPEAAKWLPDCPPVVTPLVRGVGFIAQECSCSVADSVTLSSLDRYSIDMDSVAEHADELDGNIMRFRKRRDVD